MKKTMDNITQAQRAKRRQYAEMLIAEKKLKAEIRTGKAIIDDMKEDLFEKMENLAFLKHSINDMLQDFERTDKSFFFNQILNKKNA